MPTNIAMTSEMMVTCSVVARPDISIGQTSPNVAARDSKPIKLPPCTLWLKTAKGHPHEGRHPRCHLLAARSGAL